MSGPSAEDMRKASKMYPKDVARMVEGVKVQEGQEVITLSVKVYIDLCHRLRIAEDRAKGKKCRK